MTYDPDKFDTSELDAAGLVQMEGQEKGEDITSGTVAEITVIDPAYEAGVLQMVSEARGETPNDDTAEKVAALNSETSPADKDDQKESAAESTQRRLELIGRRDAIYGEAQYALLQGDIAGFQAAALKMLEADIAILEYKVQKIDEDFNGGNFQNRGPSESPKVKDIYQYQRGVAADEIAYIKTTEMPRVTEEPDEIVRRFKFEKKTNESDKTGGLRAYLGRLVEEAEGLQTKETKGEDSVGSKWPNATKKLEGAIRMALDSGDPEMLRSAQRVAQRVLLYPELKDEINALENT